MDGALMRAVEALCIVGAALMLNTSGAVRCAVGAVEAAALMLELTTTKNSTHPFRPNSGRGLCIALAILPLVFASQLSVASAIIFSLQLQRGSDSHFIHDKITIVALAIVATLTFSYSDLLRGIILVFMHLLFVRLLVFSLPYTFTFGEAYVAAFFLVLVLYNGIASLIASAFAFLPSWCLLHPVIILTNPWAFLAQYTLLTLAMIVFATSPLMPNLKSSKTEDFDERNVSEFWARFLLIGAFADVGLLFGLDEEPFSFVMRSIFEQPARSKLFLGWLVSIAFSLTLFKRIENWLQCRIIISRKLYHCLITFIVIPGILVDIQFLAIAFVVSLSVFIACELIRISQASKFSAMLQQYMAVYVNGSQEPALVGRDCGPVILAHVYLLVGCALPVWLHLPFVGANNLLSLVPSFAGAIALGICDSAAAFVGVRFGTSRWPGSKRTFQGSLAAFASAFISLELLNIWVCNHSISVKSFLLPALGLSIMEASLDQVDNLFLPLFFYSSLNIIAR